MSSEFEDDLVYPGRNSKHLDIHFNPKVENSRNTNVKVIGI